jgi:hypothetical protein
MTPNAAPRDHATPLRKGMLARALRWALDRQCHADPGGRLRPEAGFTHDDVALGVLSAAPRATDAEPPSAVHASGIRRLGQLDARSWCLKLYASESCAIRLRPEDLAVAGRAFRAVLAEPRPTPTPGFALLGPAGPAAPAGTLVLSAYWWEDAELHRSVLLAGNAPCRALDRAERLGSLAELDLLAREARAWRETVLEAFTPSQAAYLAACCA